MRVITIHSRKGGCSKTSLTQHLGMIAAIKGQKTLLVDCDGQANLSTVYSADGKNPSLSEVFLSRIHRKMNEDELPLSEAIHHIRENLYILPANQSLFKVQEEIANFRGDRSKILKKILDPCIHWEFKFILIDTPPSAGWLVYNALAAADEIISPVPCEAFSVDGLPGLSETLKELSYETETPISISALVPTLFDARIKEAKEYLETLREGYKTLVTKTIIRIDSNVKKAQTENQTVFEYSPKTRVSNDFNDLAEEVLFHVS